MSLSKPGAPLVSVSIDGLISANRFAFRLAFTWPPREVATGAWSDLCICVDLLRGNSHPRISRAQGG